MEREKVKELSEACHKNWGDFSTACGKGLHEAYVLFPGYPGRIPGIGHTEISDVRVTFVGTGSAGAWGVAPLGVGRGSGGVVLEVGRGQDKIQLYLDPGWGAMRDIGGVVVDPSETDIVLVSHIHPDHCGELSWALTIAAHYGKTERKDLVLLANRTVLCGAEDARGGLTDRYHTKFLMRGKAVLLTAKDPVLVKQEVEAMPWYRNWFFDEIAQEFTLTKGSNKVTIRALKAMHQETGVVKDDALGFLITLSDGRKILYTGDTQVHDKETSTVFDMDKKISSYQQQEVKERIVLREDILSQYRQENIVLVIADIGGFSCHQHEGEPVVYGGNHLKPDGVAEVLKASRPKFCAIKEIGLSDYHVGQEARVVLEQYGFRDFLDFGLAYIEEEIRKVGLDTKVLVPNDCDTLYL